MGHKVEGTKSQKVLSAWDSPLKRLAEHCGGASLRAVGQGLQGPGESTGGCPRVQDFVYFIIPIGWQQKHLLVPQDNTRESLRAGSWRTRGKGFESSCPEEPRNGTSLAGTSLLRKDIPACLPKPSNRPAGASLVACWESGMAPLSSKSSTGGPQGQEHTRTPRSI